MEYYSRNQVEFIGKAGSYSYADTLHGKPIIVSRQLASYWIASLPDDAGLSVHLKEDGFWESWNTLWISKNVPRNSICIDVGANYGYFTFQLAAHGCTVYAIEANPELIPFLKKSVELNGFEDKVHVIHAVLSDTTGSEVQLNITQGSGNSTIKDYTHTGDKFINAAQVKTIALDTFCGVDWMSKAHGNKVTFVKMDIEGAEELAFDGMQKFFDKNPSCILFMELVPALYPQRAKLFYDKICEKCSIGYVDFDGNEQTIEDYSFIENDTESFRMVVIRRKLTH